MKKALVTGGGGFVGLAVVRELISLGVDTVVVGRNRYPEAERLGAEVRCGDIRDESFLVKAFHGCDIVFHVAAKAGIWGKKKDYFSINVNGTKNVIAACRKNRIEIMVHTSTPSVVLNGLDLCGVDEQVPYAGKFLCHYARTKALAEQLVLAANDSSLRTVALRPHMVWGPGDTQIIPRLLDRGRRGLLKQVGNCDNLVDISYIDNVAQAHLLAARNLEGSGSAAGQAYFISQGTPVNLWAWINDLFLRLAIPPVETKVDFQKAYWLGLILEKAYALVGSDQEPPMTRFLAEQLAKSHWFSIRKARDDLGYAPRVSTAEGLERLLAWIGEGLRSET